jgi:hypothetical protein
MGTDRGHGLHDEIIEKSAFTYSIHTKESPTSSTDQVAPEPFDEKATKRLLRKMDVNIVPFLALLYL